MSGRRSSTSVADEPARPAQCRGHAPSRGQERGDDGLAPVWKDTEREAVPEAVLGEVGEFGDELGRGAAAHKTPSQRDSADARPRAAAGATTCILVWLCVVDSI